jgi:hypothetical protein
MKEREMKNFLTDFLSYIFNPGAGFASPLLTQKEYQLMAKTGKWTEDEVTTLVEGYIPQDMDSVDALAETLGRTRKSVIGKLVSVKAYVAAEKPKAAKKDEGPTKGEILDAISKFGFDVEGLEGATKPALKRLEALIQKSV